MSAGKLPHSCLIYSRQPKLQISRYKNTRKPSVSRYCFPVCEDRLNWLDVQCMRGGEGATASSLWLYTDKKYCLPTPSQFVFLFRLTVLYCRFLCLSRLFSALIPLLSRCFSSKKVWGRAAHISEKLFEGVEFLFYKLAEKWRFFFCQNLYGEPHLKTKNQKSNSICRVSDTWFLR